MNPVWIQSQDIVKSLIVLIRAELISISASFVVCASTDRLVCKQGRVCVCKCNWPSLSVATDGGTKFTLLTRHKSTDAPKIWPNLPEGGREAMEHGQIDVHEI